MTFVFGVIVGLLIGVILLFLWNTYWFREMWMDWKRSQEGGLK